MILGISHRPFDIREGAGVLTKQIFLLNASEKKKKSVSNGKNQTRLWALLRRQNPKKIFSLASLARKLLIHLICIYMPVRHVRIYFQTASSLV